MLIFKVNRQDRHNTISRILHQLTLFGLVSDRTKEWVYALVRYIWTDWYVDKWKIKMSEGKDKWKEAKHVNNFIIAWWRLGENTNSYIYSRKYIKRKWKINALISIKSEAHTHIYIMHIYTYKWINISTSITVNFMHIVIDSERKLQAHT